MNQISGPRFDDVGVLGLMGHRWDGPWMGAMQFFTRLSQYFHVVWINPPYYWRQRAWQKRWVQPQHRKRVSFDRTSAWPGLTVCEPSQWFPVVGRSLAVGKIMDRWRWQPARKRLDDYGCEKTITYIWRPSYDTAVEIMHHDVSCYHINDEYSFSPTEQPLSDRESKLISKVDQVFINSPALVEKKGKINPNTLCVPNGVDYHSFATPRAEPAEMRNVPHPRIGYVGCLKSQLDFTLLNALAERHRDWSFVFVGPRRFIADLNTQNSVERLLSMPNVYYLGNKSIDTLPGYVQHLDVCMLCYVQNDYTKYIYPLKLHEYLAAGRPVVGVPIRSLLEFKGIIELADTPEQWSSALVKSLTPEASNSANIEARHAVARQHDWDHLVAQIVHALCARLGPSYLDRLHSLAHGQCNDCHPVYSDAMI